MEFVGKGQPLTRNGITAALAPLGLDPGDAAYIWTVVEVETAGVTQGFGFRLDRRPQILFERHKFRDFTNGQFDSQPSVSGSPGMYGPLSAQYTRLEKALDLCQQAGLGPEPALKSASWGMGQVMGFNHTVAGFPSAAAMVQAMVESEDAQLAGMSGFLQGNGLAQALRDQDWATFAKRYNGAGYWKNQYDTKLAQNFRRFASGSLPNLEVRSAQAALFYLGYAPGKVDGVLGNRTRTALASFRIAAGLPAGDGLDGPTYEKLCEKAGFAA